MRHGHRLHPLLAPTKPLFPRMKYVRRGRGPIASRDNSELCLSSSGNRPLFPTESRAFSPLLSFVNLRGVLSPLLVSGVTHSSRSTVHTHTETILRFETLVVVSKNAPRRSSIHHLLPSLSSLPILRFNGRNIFGNSWGRCVSFTDHATAIFRAINIGYTILPRNSHRLFDVSINNIRFDRCNHNFFFSFLLIRLFSSGWIWLNVVEVVYLPMLKERCPGYKRASMRINIRIISSMRYIFSILFFPFFFFHPENVFDITESLFLRFDWKEFATFEYYYLYFYFHLFTRKLIKKN